MPNLITRWFALMSQRGLNKSDAVRAYNRTHGTAYSYHRFREYEVGDRPTPHDVAQNMRRDVLPGLLSEVLSMDRATERQIHDLLVGLSPPSCTTPTPDTQKGFPGAPNSPRGSKPAPA